MSRRCPACRGAMFDLSAIGVDLGSRICSTCWGKGVRWRSLATQSLCTTYGDALYACYSLTLDPPQEWGAERTVSKMDAWSNAAGRVALWTLRRGMPLARLEGPTRGR